MRRRSVNLALIAAVVVTGGVDALMTDIGPGKSECFLLQMPKGGSCSGNFEIISENAASDVLVKATGPKPHKTVYYESRGDEEGNFEFVAETEGDQTLCFTNDHATEIRSIGFAFRPDSQDLLTSEDVAGEAATEENVKAMIDVANDLTQGLDMLRDHQEYMRAREEQHRNTVSSINSKVYWWTLAEAVILVGMAVWQILYIRTFFEVKRYV